MKKKGKYSLNNQEPKKSQPSEVKKELTEKEKAQREKDIVVKKYNPIIPGHMHKALDQERREKWVSSEEIKKMPQWEGKVAGAVRALITAEDRQAWRTMSRVEKNKYMDGIAKKVMKEVVTRAEVVRETVWRQMVKRV